jgi:hypothetical protein
MCCKTLSVLILLVVTTASGLFASDPLQASFESPADSAKPHTWWHWMNGFVSAEGITADLEAMQRVGIGGFQAFQIERRMTPGPVKYMSYHWRDLMKHTITEADRLGLEVCFHNCAGWSSSGGPWITPEASMMEVAWTEQQVTGSKSNGPKSATIKLAAPTGRDKFTRDIAVLAFPTPKSELGGKPGFRVDNWKAKAGFDRDNNIQHDTRKVPAGDTINAEDVIDLSATMKSGGKLTWDVPAGQWTVVRFAYVPTTVRNRPAPQEGRGYECDKLSKSAVDLHWKNTVQKVLDDAGPLAGKVLNNVLVDSYEVMEQNWTKGFEKEFEKRMGYDLTKFLPTLTGRVVNDLDVTERFLWDFRRVIADMLNENYYQHFADLCHQHGLQMSCEPYGRPGNLDDFTVADIADIPMGEWWARSPAGLFHGSSKLASSAAHTNGRRIVGAEAFTAGRATAAFVQHPYNLKAQGDYFFCKGINRVIFHTFCHQPWADDVLPGMTMGPWGIQNHRNNTWYEQGKAWNRYLARSQSLLQQGVFQADICYFTGEAAPQTNPVREKMQPPVPTGYDYDMISCRNFMKLTIRDGMIVLPGLMQYRLLVMPDGPVRPAVMQKAHELLKDGGNLVWAKPDRSPSLVDYPSSDQSIQQTADQIWGPTDGDEVRQNTVGNGTVYWPGSLDDILLSLDVLPDVEFHSVQAVAPTLFAGIGYEWIHRTLDDRDIYFISNQQEIARQVEVTFRVENRQPQLWDAQTGQTESIPVYSTTDDGRTLVKLHLEPAASVFVVFGPPTNTTGVTNLLHDGSSPFDHKAAKPKPLTIVRATYGDLDGDKSRQADVTNQISAKIVNESINEEVKWKLVKTDPAEGMMKQLRVEYQIGEERFTTVVDQNDQLILNKAINPVAASPPAATLMRSETGDMLRVWETGEHQVVYSDGKRDTFNVKEIPDPIDLSQQWTLHCPKGWGPTDVRLDKLMSWTQHDDPELKYFSGTAVYRKSFDLSANKLAANPTIRLDLGDVQLIAEVIVNGENLGVLWKPPFQIDVTDSFKAGSNELEIRVTNLWVNRLIGDQQFPDIYEYESPVKPGESLITEIPSWLTSNAPRPKTQAKTFTVFRYQNKDSPLLESGLIGPVKLQFAVEKPLP